MTVIRRYRIGKVASMLKVRSSVLRFWETEFPELVPERGESGQRLYTEETIELLRRIKDLLYVRGLTIEGARLALSRTSGYKDLSEEQKQEQMARGEQLEERRSELASRRREKDQQRREADSALLGDIVQELRSIRTALSMAGNTAESTWQPAESTPAENGQNLQESMS